MKVPFRFITDQRQYFTDGSLIVTEKGSHASGGFIVSQNNESYSGKFDKTISNIHCAEAIAFGMALDDIEKNSDQCTKYTIYTDSDTLLKYLNTGINKSKDFRKVAKEVKDKYEKLKEDLSIDVNLVKSHCTPKEQQIYFKHNNNKKITYDEASYICQGNSAIDCFVKGHTYTGNKFPSIYGF